ncbi:MAG: hypothetical protein IPJ14_23630 [Kineosporiaceae bacterium]|nr:hypothetical protein [Kineosporiaceae bacterium]
MIAPRVSIRPNLRVSAGAVRIDATPGALQPGPRQAYTAEARTTPDGDATAPSLHLQAQGPYPSVVLAPDEVADADGPANAGSESTTGRCPDGMFA